MINNITYEYKKATIQDIEELVRTRIIVLRAANKLSDDVDMSLVENKQFIETAKLRYQLKKKQIANDIAISKLYELLTYTMPEYDGKLIRVPTREEFLILNRIALCLKWNGEKEKAIALYEEILKKYLTSTVKPEHHSHIMMLLYLNFLELLEVSDCLDRAKEIGKVGFQLVIKYHRGDLLAMFLANTACVLEKSETQAERLLVLPCLNSSYHLLKLYQLENKSEKVKRYIEKCD